MDYCIKMLGKTRRLNTDPWSDVTCWVTYSDAKAHRQIVEDSFQYHLGLDIEYMREHHSDHFTAPHNAVRAILLYYYFKLRHRYFDDRTYEYIALQHLPERAPDASGETFELWVEPKQ